MDHLVNKNTYAGRQRESLCCVGTQFQPFQFSRLRKVQRYKVWDGMFTVYFISEIIPIILGIILTFPSIHLNLNLNSTLERCLTQRPPVDTPVVSPGLEDLRCQVLRGPAHCPAPVWDLLTNCPIKASNLRVQVKCPKKCPRKVSKEIVKSR